MIYQVQETRKSVYDYWPKHGYCIFFIKTSPSFTDVHAGIAYFGIDNDKALLINIHN
jgi:hypothetical protein